MLSANSFNPPHNPWANRPFVVRKCRTHRPTPGSSARLCGFDQAKWHDVPVFKSNGLMWVRGGPARPWRRGPRADRRSGLWVQNFSTDRWEDCRFRPQTVAGPLVYCGLRPRLVDRPSKTKRFQGVTFYWSIDLLVLRYVERGKMGERGIWPQHRQA